MLEKVFIGSSTETLPIANKLKCALTSSYEVMLWTDGVFTPGTYLLDSLVQAGDFYDFFVLFAVGDDQVISRGKEHAAPRDNLIFELGLFLGKVRKERVIIITDKGNPVKLPSDISGVEVLRIDLTKANKKEIQRACLSLTGVIDKLGRRNRQLDGQRLFKYPEFYPIDLTEGRFPVFVKSKFVKALSYFTDTHYDELAATDLAYLYLSNFSDFESKDRLDESEKHLLHGLEDKYRLRRFIDEMEREHEEIFGNYKRILTDLGEMLKGVYFEAILHDIRNPFRSIIVAANSQQVTKRPVGGPSTRFVVQFVKDQGDQLLDAMSNGSKVCYLKKFEKDKFLKAATTPIWHDRYGLVGIVCFNIDINSIEALAGREDASSEIDELLCSLTQNSGQTPQFELDMF